MRQDRYAASQRCYSIKILFIIYIKNDVDNHLGLLQFIFFQELANYTFVLFESISEKNNVKYSHYVHTYFHLLKTFTLRIHV